MTPAFFSLGSNLGERMNNLQTAVRQLAAQTTILAQSPVYETAPWGDEDQPAFLNMCVAVTTELAPAQLLAYVKRIEHEMGREPTRRWGPRLIDIDILLYGHEVVQQPNLTIPHDSMPMRAFVLAPLADLIPDFVHPVTGKPIARMLREVDATGVVRLGEHGPRPRAQQGM